MFEQIRLSSYSVALKKTSVGFFSTALVHSLFLIVIFLVGAFVRRPGEVLKDTPIKFITSMASRSLHKSETVLLQARSRASASLQKPKAHSMHLNKFEPQVNVKTTKVSEVVQKSENNPDLTGSDSLQKSVGNGSESADFSTDPVLPVGLEGGTSEYRSLSRAPLLVRGEREPQISASLMELLRGSKGVVLLKVRIGIKGEVEQVDIVRSTFPLLNEVLVKHIRANWQFEPSLSGGKPARVEYLQPFSFVF